MEVASRSDRVVLGFRPHTYWTAVVALGGELAEPKLLTRRRIEFAAGDERFVYHQAATLSRSKAEARIGAARRSVAAAAGKGIAALLRELAERSLSVRLAMVPVSRSPAGALADIVKSHAAIHAAEGHFYREVLADACGSLGLNVGRVAEKELLLEASRSLARPAARLESQLKLIGAAAGPPWGEDQRLATLAAWIGLADLAA